MATVGTVTKALPSTVRWHNTSAVIKLLYSSRELTRADLARSTGLTRVVISDIVSNLIGEGLVVERGLNESKGPGKRGMLLSLDEHSRSILVMDLSQPYLLRGAVMDLAGHIVMRREQPLRDEKIVDVELVKRLCRSLADAAPSPVLALGVSCPGIISPSGLVIQATNLGWADVDLQAALENCVSCPVYVENDANLDAVAELRFGEHDADMLLLRLSAGIGSGLVLSGHLVRGASMQAGEIGHVVVEPHGRLCKCGKRGCLETVVSGPLLLSQVADEPQKRTEILSQAGSYLGRALSVSMGLVDVPKIMVLGDSRIVNETLLKAMQHEINANVSAPYRQDIVVHRSALSDDANLLGACALVLTKWIDDGLHWDLA